MADSADLRADPHRWREWLLRPRRNWRMSIEEAQPLDNGVRLDDQEQLRPVSPGTFHGYPEGTVRVIQWRTRLRLRQDGSNIQASGQGLSDG